MRRWLGRLLLVAAVAVAAVALKLTLFASEPVPVEVVEAAAGRVEETVTNSRAGTVKARRRAKLSPETGGTVTALPFREGQRVAAGDLVLQLDDSTQQARLRLALGDAETAEAEERRACLLAERAAREHDRMRRLAAEAIVSADLLDQAESARQVADAACHAARTQHTRTAAAIAVARTSLEKMTLRAPFAGVVAEVGTEIGEWVTPSPPALPVPPVVDILDPDSTYISAPMDEVDSARILPDQPARVTVDSHRDRIFPGRVTRVAPYVLDLVEQNRTVEIEIEIDHGQPAVPLLPGTSADVEVVLEVRDDVLRIPTSALMEGRRVLLFDAGLLAEREVKIGLRNWDFTEIRGGLEAGDRIVTSLDRAEVRDGAEAQVMDPKETP